MDGQRNRKKILFGFRSGTPWKSILAACYYIFCAAVFVLCMVTPPPVPAGIWDTLVMKLSSAVIFLWMLSPMIFLSDTPLRSRFPFLRNHTRLDTLVGMAIVFILFTILFRSTESLHTEEYQVQFAEYLDTAMDGFIEAGGE